MPANAVTLRKAAKNSEIAGLLSFVTFRVILREEVIFDANVLPGCSVLTIKTTEDGDVKFKARCVIRGHRNFLRHMMIYTASTIQP